MNCKTIWMVLGMLFLVGFGAVLAQQEATKYEPTEIQGLRMKVALQDAQLSGVNKNIADKDYSDKLQAFTEAQEKIKKENKWPDTVQYNFGLQKFVDSKPPVPNPPPPSAKPAPTPAPAKP